jgi:predicted small secreted protein
VLPYETSGNELRHPSEQSPGRRVGRSIEEVDMIRMTAAFFVFAVLAGCETVEGLGQDVEAGGEAIQRTAEEVQAEP